MCVHHLANGIIERGLETAVITPARNAGNNSIFKYKTIRLNPLLNRFLFINFPLGKMYLEKILSEIQKKYNFDVWQVTMGYPFGAASADFFNRNKIPCVLRCTGEDIQMAPALKYGYRLNKKVDRQVKENYKKFTAFVALSNSMRKDYLSLGIPEARVNLIPNGVDCSGFKLKIDRERIRNEIGVGNNQKLIITVGRNHPKKGFRYIPQAIKRLRDKQVDFKWLLVGKDSQGIKALAEKENLGEYFIAKEASTGISEKGKAEAPNYELMQYYKASDIFLFPTLLETFGIVLIEAMAAGLPIVTTDAPGADDIIKDNENGLKCKVGDIDSMVETIVRIFSDKALAKRLSKNALRDARNYDWDIITEKYLELYKNIGGEVCHKPPAKVRTSSLSKIKVAHIISDLDVGGAESMLVKTLRNFKSDRYEHFVISLHPQKNSLRGKIEKEGFKVYLLNIGIKNFILPLIKLISILKRERPQIVHSYLFHADIFGRIFARLTRVPVVISSLRNENIGGRLYEILLGVTDFCVDKVTAVSRNVADVHIAKGTTKKNKISVIYNGLELEDSSQKEASRIRRNLDIRDDLFLLLTIASLEPKKGHIFLFEALSMLKKEGCRFKLLVVGHGREKERLERKIANLGLENEVVLMGKRDDIQEILVASDAFVLPSIWEGLPNALLEAMAAGLPVIATRVGGIPEVITDSETGLLVETKDSNALAKAIERIAKEDGFSRRLAQNARDCVRRNFDIKKTVEQTEELYEELLREHGKS